MNRVLIAGYVSSRRKCCISPPAPVAKVRVGESVRHADGSGEIRNSRTSTAFFTETLPISPNSQEGQQRIRRRPDRAATGHRTRGQQAADGTRDRGEPVSRDRARPTREQSGGIGRWKKNGQWITQCGLRG
jgi:hypothetical protein